uniref:Ixodegrin B n=1 Tax=Rhipicephalus appendiculatus TaxID=34631 RepID=A0A131Z5E7_RHIAP
MEPVNCNVHVICLVLILTNVALAVPPGFDPAMLKFIQPGHRISRRKIGTACTSNFHCPGGSCCVDRGLGFATCQPLAGVGQGCSSQPYNGVFYGFCPCRPEGRCNQMKRVCEPVQP